MHGAAGAVTESLNACNANPLQGQILDQSSVAGKDATSLSTV